MIKALTWDRGEFEIAVGKGDQTRRQQCWLNMRTP